MLNTNNTFCHNMTKSGEICVKIKEKQNAQTATECTFTYKYTHKHRAERGGTNVTHRILFIETLSRNTETMDRLC